MLSEEFTAPLRGKEHIAAIEEPGQMRKLRRRLAGLTTLLILLVALLAACADPGGSGLEEGPESAEEGAAEQGGIEQDPTGGDDELPPIIPDTTKVVEGPVMQSMEEISPEGTFTFVAATAEAEAFLASVQDGHVLVSDVSQLAPDGFLRKVVAVNRSGNRFVIETAEATLEEAIEQGVVEISRELTSNDLAAASPGEKGIAVAKLRPDQAQGVIRIKIPNVELTDNVFANGEVEVKPKFNFKVVVKKHQIAEVLFTNVTNEKVTLELQAQLAHVGVRSRKELPPIPFKTFTIWIGPLPVVIRPQLVVVVGVNGDVSTNVTTSVVHNGVLHAGVHYDRTNKWAVEPTDFTHTYDFNPPYLTTDASLKAFAGPRLMLSLYGVPGPYGQMDGYLELAADLLKTPWWEFYGGLEAEIGVEVQILGLALLSYSEKVLDEKWPIADAGGPAPGGSGSPPPGPPAGQDQVGGRVVWGNLPVPGAAVEVKPPGDFFTEPVLANAVTDAGGHFYLEKPLPGSYMIYAVAPGPEFWEFSGRPLDVPPGGGDIDVGDLYLSQRLQLLDPIDGSVISTTRPTLRWDGFPGAAFYKISLLDEQGRDVLRERTPGTSFTLPFDLQRGVGYEWFVDAFNGDDIPIAHFASWRFMVQP